MFRHAAGRLPADEARLRTRSASGTGSTDGRVHLAIYPSPSPGLGFGSATAGGVIAAGSHCRYMSTVYGFTQHSGMGENCSYTG